VSFEDKSIVCVDCGQEFVHSAKDQERYAQRGFTNEPKRCRTCRDKRKAQAGGNRGPGGGNRADAPPPRSGGSRPVFSASADHGGPRESFEVVCASCGVTTTVPFKPTKGRPVYCRDCFRSHRST
jgi:CxxC-x17-CxxC domain-containing protein